MRFITLSDTHNKHKHLKNLPSADAIIHAGDITSRGSEQEVSDFLKWFSGLDYAYKIFIAGNHDFLFENANADELKELIPSNIIYLNDSGVVIEGIHIWGSPVTPWFHDWAFNRQRGKEIAQHWNLIPNNTDILVTHGPVYQILDKTTSGIDAGCEDLLEAVKRTKPSIFISGHIHEAHGEATVLGTQFINASVLDENYKLSHAPILFELSK